MPTVQDLTQSAQAEWQHWGSSTWDLKSGNKRIAHTDDEPDYAEYVVANYCSIVEDEPSLDDIENDHYYWSAVGMSAFFKKAGFGKSQFPFSNAHSTWIRAFVRARKNNADALYHAFRLSEPKATPDVGDLIGYTYASGISFDEAQSFFDKTGNYPSHTDVVVAKRAGEVDVIGANVLDSVTRKTVPLDAKGLIADRKHKWFVVMKRRF